MSSDVLNGAKDSGRLELDGFGGAEVEPHFAQQHEQRGGQENLQQPSEDQQVEGMEEPQGRRPVDEGLPVCWSELPYRPFPVECLPSYAASFVLAYARAMGCDESFLALPALATMAGAIGNTHRIRIKDSWTEPAVLWTAVVGNSGARKSPPIEAATRPLRDAQTVAYQNHAYQMIDFQADMWGYQMKMRDWKQGNGDPQWRPSEPIAERILVGDVAVESLALMLSRQPRGLTVCCDELDGWLGSFDASRGGKGTGPARWLEMHGGRPMSIDRRTGTPRTLTIPYASVSVTGGIQPEILSARLTRSHLSNGLFARLLFAFPPPRQRRWTEMDVQPFVAGPYADLIGNLLQLPLREKDDGRPVPQLVDMAPDARRRFIQFVNEFGQEQDDADESMTASFAKLEGYAARFALVLHLARWAAHKQVDPLVCDLTSVEHGITLSRWFANESRRVRALVCETPEEAARRRLIGWLHRRGGRGTARELKRSHPRQFVDAEAARTFLNQLASDGLGVWVDRSTTEKGGRPTQEFVLSDASVEEGGFVNRDAPPSTNLDGSSP